ncbi:hypothetical protein GCM10027035_47770 [Emticicia sediminis]
MELLINNTSVDLFEEQEVIIQQNSPLVGFKLQGDKAYSFSIPSSDGLKKAVGGIGHLQKSEVSKEIYGSLRAAGRTALEGKVKVRRANDRASTIDVIATPGGMDAKWWNGAIQAVDLGGDTFLTEEKTIDIVAVSLDKMIDIILPSVATVSLRELLLKKNQYRMRFFDGGTAFYEHVFMPKLYQEKRDFDEWVFEAQTSFDDLSDETNYFYINDKQISVKRTGLRAANLKITIEMVITAGVYGILYEILDFQPTKYLSVLPGTRKNVVRNKPYFFPTILDNNFYGEKPGASIALNTKDINGELILNSEQERTKYPISPCFRWKWIFEQLAAKMGFTLVESDWSLWKDKAVCSMVDMAQQCPVIAMPFNVYQTAIKYADYMPVGFTVKDMFDEFGAITGTTWDFDTVNKQLRLIQIDPIFDAAPQMIEADALDLRGGIDYEDVTRYKLSYSTMIEAEKAIAPTGWFDDMPTLAEDFQLLSMKLLPLIPYKFLGVTYGSQCLSVGKSVFFDLKEQTPAARVFWYNAEQDKAMTEMNGVSLSRVDANGLYEKFWKRMLSRKKGKKVKATCNDTLVNYLKLDFFRVTQHRGVWFLINQKQIKLRNNRKYHEFELEIEVIS